MLDQADHEAGGRGHHRGLCGTCIGDLIATGIYKAFGLQELICFIEIVHIHADSRDRLRHSVTMSDIQIKPVGILHPDTGKVLSLLNIFGQMTALKSQELRTFP